MTCALYRVPLSRANSSASSVPELRAKLLQFTAALQNAVLCGAAPSGPSTLPKLHSHPASSTKGVPGEDR